MDRNSKSDYYQGLLVTKEPNEPRNNWVHLPSDYTSSNKNYPVIYLLVGGGHFNYVYNLVDYLSSYDRNRIPEMVLVAIPNVNRGRDLIPTSQYERSTDNSIRTKNGGLGLLYTTSLLSAMYFIKLATVSESFRPFSISSEIGTPTVNPE